LISGCLRVVCNNKLIGFSARTDVAACLRLTRIKTSRVFGGSSSANSGWRQAEKQKALISQGFGMAM